MQEIFLTAFIVYFVVIDPIGSAPVFLAVTAAQDRARKLRTAVEATLAATAILLFFALCGAQVLAYLGITEAAFKIAGGTILFLIAFEMLTAKRQRRKREDTTGDGAGEAAGGRAVAEHDPDHESPAVYPLAIPLLAGPAAIMSVIVVNAGYGGDLAATLAAYAALVAVMAVTAVILCFTVVAEGWMNERITMVVSRITAIILAGLSVQYVVDGLALLGLVAA